MRKKLTLCAFFAVILVGSLLGVAVFAQTITPTAQPSPTVTTQNVVTYGNGANVNVKLPNGSLNHPLDLRIVVMKSNDNSTPDQPNLMEFFIWVPSMNQYALVAFIRTAADPAMTSWLQGLLNGTPAWTPPIMQNIFNATANQLQVNMVDDNLWVNLTTSFNITLPAALGGNFTIPPMTLMFVPIGESFFQQETTVLAKPQLSGWTLQMSHTDVPSWVRVTIPAWSNTPIETVGTIMLDATTVHIPPSS